VNLSSEQLLKVAQHAFVRMDGAWFLALTKKFGLETALETDLAAWKQFSYIFGKNLRNHYLPNPVWPDGLLDALDTFCSVLNIQGRNVSVDGGRMVVRITDCETQKAGVADYGIIAGLFGKDIQVNVAHAKNLSHGDDCCEVVITRRKKAS
jgi:predicted hydrocarbon binding protein